MSQLLRVISQGRWLDAVQIAPCPNEELPADPLGDLRTSANSLSVYRIISQSDIIDVVGGYSASRDRLQVLDYAIFDDAHLNTLNIPLQEEEGKTPGKPANQLHLNLIGLTAHKLIGLVQIILTGEISRVPWPQVGANIRAGLNSGQIDEARVPESLMVDLERKKL